MLVLYILCSVLQTKANSTFQAMFKIIIINDDDGYRVSHIPLASDLHKNPGRWVVIPLYRWASRGFEMLYLLKDIQSVRSRVKF